MNFSGLLHNFGPDTLSGLQKGSIVALFALGYTLVYGVLRLINFAHSEVFMVGTFAAIGVWGVLGYDNNTKTPGFLLATGMILVGILAAMVASGATAMIVELVAYRPLRRRNAPPLAFLITAIGASLTLSEGFGVFTHHDQKGAPRLVAPTDLVVFGNTHIRILDLLLLGLALVMMFALDLFVNRTRMGRGIRAVAQSPDSAALMGVNKNRVIALVFLLGGLMAGVAAVMYLMKIGNTRYDAGFTLGIESFTAAVLGGIGSLPGAMLGGLAIGLIETLWSAYFSVEYKDVAAFSILIIVLIFLPTGLLGRPEVEKV